MNRRVKLPSFRHFQDQFLYYQQGEKRGKKKRACVSQGLCFWRFAGRWHRTIRIGIRIAADVEALPGAAAWRRLGTGPFFSFFFFSLSLSLSLSLSISLSVYIYIYISPLSLNIYRRLSLSLSINLALALYHSPHCLSQISSKCRPSFSFYIPFGLYLSGVGVWRPSPLHLSVDKNWPKIAHKIEPISGPSMMRNEVGPDIDATKEKKHKTWTKILTQQFLDQMLTLQIGRTPYIYIYISLSLSLSLGISLSGHLCLQTIQTAHQEGGTFAYWTNASRQCTGRLPIVVGGVNDRVYLNHVVWKNRAAWTIHKVLQDGCHNISSRPAKSRCPQHVLSTRFGFLDPPPL